MENKEFSLKLESRTKQFSIGIIKLSASLPGSSEFKVTKNQLTKYGTSIGANYRETNRSSSKADFINKIRICEAEASETVYWLEIIEELNQVNANKLIPVLKEAREILALFTSISKKAKTLKT